jgi:hypothetical protein
MVSLILLPHSSKSLCPGRKIAGLVKDKGSQQWRYNICSAWYPELLCPMQPQQKAVKQNIPKSPSAIFFSWQCPLFSSDDVGCVACLHAPYSANTP